MRIQDLPNEAGPHEVLRQNSWLDRLLHRPVDRAPDVDDSSSEALRTRIAWTLQERFAAEELVRRRYEWRGYKLAKPQEQDGTGLSAGDHWVTLLAEAQGRLLGTLTIGPDGRRGLLAATTYREEIDRLRRKGHRLGELTKLALEKGVDWKTSLDALVQAAWLVTRVVHALTDVVIEVNPRHVSFYRRVFGFEPLGAGKVCQRVGAPSVLLRLDLDAFGQRLERSGVGR